MNDRNLHGGRLDSKLGLCILGNEAGERLAILIGMNLRAEHVFQVLVFEHGGRDRGRDPENLLLLFDFRRERHSMSA